MQTLLMATRTGTAGTDAEPILINTDDGRARLELDDGQILDLDHTELLAALGVQLPTTLRAVA